MRHLRLAPLAVVGFVLGAAWSIPHTAAAQNPAPPTIHRVTLQPDTAVLTISGTGLGSSLRVLLEGQPMAVLPGATDTLVQVLVSDTILTTPGMYRLTVVDPVRQMMDGFVLSSPAGSVVTVSGSARDRSGDGRAPRTTSATATREDAAGRRAASDVDSAAPPATVIEGPTNTAVGLNALASNTTGFDNSATGAGALGFNTTGHDNTASGYAALNLNTTGSYNTATGSSALRRNTGMDNTAVGADALTNNTTGRQNTAAGSLALFSNTTGESNTAIGFSALDRNTTGSFNTGVGMHALYRNSTGTWSTATGVNALEANTSGYFNTATGGQALFRNTTGFYNTASGVNALASNTTGSSNTGTGVSALGANTDGVDNTASGVNALALNTSGWANTANGLNALRDNTIGYENTANGRGALRTNTSGQANTASGADALYNTTGHKNVGVGTGAGYGATTGSYNVYLGAEVFGTAADANTMRLGLPHTGGVGQNRTFIAGIHGTQLTGPAVQVFVDANGQLGTLTPPIASGSGTTAAPLALEQQLRAQQAIIEDLRARLARLEARTQGSRRR